MIVKICGIKDTITILNCEKNKIDFFGMIFYSKSPRNISVNEAKKLQIFSKNLNIEGVGVFVNENIDDIKLKIKELELNFVQLHGDEDNNYIKEIKKLNTKVIKKISIKNTKDLNNIENYYSADYFLFDYKPNSNEMPGGNAKSFDWKIVNNLKVKKPWFLSGGINLSNIELIKSRIKPFGIDLSSGVEKELGIKDNHIINNFMDKFNNA